MIAAIVIGRNEGTRLIACLESLRGDVAQIIYVDSGSTDGSLEAARKMGAEAVALDTTLPFTAARARNAGLAHLSDAADYVMLVDGDCAVRNGWITAATGFLQTHPEAAVACGRRRERAPEASVYNRLCDNEWNTPVGQTQACGGDAVMRVAALRAVGGYRDDLIAGEEPELCVRLRAAGWQIWRLDHEMTWHDAAMTRFSQWWRRMRRAGFAYAEGAALHGAPPERHWVAERRRALIWGLTLPLALLAGLAVWPALALLGALIYPAQVLRLAKRQSFTRQALENAFFLTIGKFAETAGILEYHWTRWRGTRRGLIEYK